MFDEYTYADTPLYSSVHIFCILFYEYYISKYYWPCLTAGIWVQNHWGKENKRSLSSCIVIQKLCQHSNNKELSATELITILHGTFKTFKNELFFEKTVWISQKRCYISVKNVNHWKYFYLVVCFSIWQGNLNFMNNCWSCHSNVYCINVRWNSNWIAREFNSVSSTSITTVFRWW